ncbi:MAG TPA: FAD-dependent oxidoreductase [Caldimonas sp.]|nr:FAD-dependent oxidoreductase [Caldimonas sp.]
MPTFYETTGDPALRFAPLAQAIGADVAIVGGGFAGLATALGLLERDVRDCVLLEAEAIGFGASGRNGGFVSAGFSVDAPDLVDDVGRDQARDLYRMTEDAVNLIRARIDRYRIDCDAVFRGILVANWFHDDHVLRELQHLMHDVFGLDWRWLSRDELRSRLLTERYHSALFEADGFHFNPLRYAQGEVRVLRDAGVRLHEQSPVTAIVADGSAWRVDTAGGGSVRCREVVVACGGYIGEFCSPLSRAVLPIATYVMTTEPLGDRLQTAMRTDAAVFDTRFAFDYYRPLPDTRLLWGGRMSIHEPSSEELVRLLTRDLLRVYPQLEGVRVSHAWSGLMGYSRHEMPQIGRLPNGIWYVMGFGGHGVAAATFGGEVIARALTGEAGIPSGLARYGLARTFGAFGRIAAQATYWWLQGRDAVRDWRSIVS